MSYNSDFDVRLATLGALGGDTAKTYDSVYAIDLAILEAIEQGGGGEGLNYNQIKNLLATSGVTEIVVNGDGDSITLDYDLLAQIGQGGMDYDDVKAALAASGLTSILVLDGSGHTKEMNYALLDQIGEGIDWNEVKQDLAQSGVTDILFDDGSGNTINMDYDLVSQIGQGGGDYICVNGIDALSGITDPKDGMMAYVDAYNEIQEKKVVVTDYYNKDWFHINVEWNDQSTAMLSLRTGGNDVDLTNGYFEDGQGSYGDIHNHKDKMPYKMIFNNGAIGYVAHQEYGSTYPENFETILTIWFDKYDGEYPTITFDYSDDGVLVSSSITTDMVSITYPQIGVYKYYADVQKWLPFEVNWDTMDYEQKQDVLNKGAQYRKPLSCFRTNDNYGVSVRKYDAFYNGYYDYEENPRVNKIAFTTKTYRNPSTDICSLQFNCEWDDGSQKWSINGINDNNMPDRNSVNSMIRGFVSTEDSNNTYDGIYYGGLYSAAVNGTYSGVTISTTIPIDSTISSDWNYQGTASVSVRGRNSREVEVSELGHVFTYSIGNISASTNAEWIVFDYCNTWNDDENKNITVIMAMKVEDNGNDTFTLSIFITNDNWKDGDDPSDHHWWVDEHWGRTDECEFRYNSDRGYTWTVTEHQTVTFTPHLYTQIRETILNKQDVRMVYKLL